MDKISKIIPSSARVASTDLKSTPALRPGTPAFGRPVGVSSLSEKTISAAAATTAQKAMAKHLELSEKRSGQNALGPEIVEDMTNRFFMHRTRNLDGTPMPTSLDISLADPAEAGMSDPVSEPENIATETIGTMSEEDPRVSESLSDQVEASRYTPPGSFLDVRV